MCYGNASIRCQTQKYFFQKNKTTLKDCCGVASSMHCSLAIVHKRMYSRIFYALYNWASREIEMFNNCLNNFQSEGISTSSIFAYAQLTEPVNMSPLSTRSSSFPFLSRSFTMFRCITSLTSSSCSRRISSTLFVFRILFIRTNSFSSLLSGSVLLRSSKLRHRFSSERRHVCCNTGKIFKIGHSNN